MGVLNINLGPNKVYVLNQQPPNRQIWLSSPISGPKRFEYDSETKLWISTKNEGSLIQMLNKELTDILHVKIEIPE
ncbi:hypothetical protein BB558_001052 [Smittium angustum]|uniref:Ferroxidase n=1 Tax=Smittium angustum TaxID=133377 RepID=A0A2U1JCH7_SMIAN|nr:hypothetical protein BB558_001052 [Smittium angustum]